MQLTKEEKAFMKQFERTSLHRFRDILYYAKLLKKLTIR